MCVSVFVLFCFIRTALGPPTNHGFSYVADNNVYNRVILKEFLFYDFSCINNVGIRMKVIAPCVWREVYVRGR